MSDQNLPSLRLSESNKIQHSVGPKSYLNDVKVIQFSNDNCDSNHNVQENSEDFTPSDEDVKNYESIFNSLLMYSYGPDSLVRKQEHLLSALKAALPKLHYDLKLFPDNGFNSKDSLNRFVEDDILTDLKKNNIDLYEEMRHCLEILYIGLSIAVQNTEEHNAQHNIDKDKKAIRTDYPEFFDSSHKLAKGMNTTEVERLTLFRYVLKIAFTIIPAKGNKGRLLEIVTRITEGYKNEYKTGTGQSASTQRRVMIYERDGDVVPIPKNRKKKGSSTDELGDASTLGNRSSPEAVVAADEAGDLSTIATNNSPIECPHCNNVAKIPCNITVGDHHSDCSHLNGSNEARSCVSGSASAASQPHMMYYAAPALISSTDTGTSANANALHPDHLLSTRSLETAIIGMSHLDVTDESTKSLRSSSQDNFSRRELRQLPSASDRDIIDDSLSPNPREMFGSPMHMALNVVMQQQQYPDGAASLDGFDTRRDEAIDALEAEFASELNHPTDGDMFSQASHNSYFNSIFGGISYQNGMDMMYNDDTILDQPPQYSTVGIGANASHNKADDDDDSIKHSQPSVMSQMNKKNARYSSGASQYSNTHPQQQRQFGPGFGQAQMYEQHQQQQEFKADEMQGNVDENDDESEDGDEDENDGIIHAGARLSFISALSNSGGPPKKYNNNLFRSIPGMMPPQNPSARAATQMQAQQQLFMQHQQRAEQEIQQLQLQQQQYQQQQPQAQQSSLFYSSNMAPPLNPPHARTVPYPQQLGPSNGYYQDWQRNNAATPFSSDKETDTTASFSTPSGSPRPSEHSASSQSYFNGNPPYVPNSTAGVEYLHENHYVQSKQQDQRGKSFHPGSLVSNAMTSMSSTFRRVFPKKSSSAKQYNM